MLKFRLFALSISLFSTSAFSQGIQGTHTLTELAAGVFLAEGNFSGANATIIIGDSDVLIVDSHSTPAAARALIADVRQLTDHPIRYVVNTHWHVDHQAGNPAYQAAFQDGVTFISHHLTREDIPTLGMGQFHDTLPYLRSPITAAEQQLASGVDDHGSPLSQAQREQIEAFVEDQKAFLALAESGDFQFTTLPDLTFERSIVLHSDHRTIQILYFFKGHTRGDVVVYLPAEKILVAGDLLTQPILWTWSSYPRDYIKTLNAIDQLDIDQIVMGHGPALNGKHYLQLAIDALTSVVAHVDQAINDGISLEQTQHLAQTEQSIQSFRNQFVGDDPENSSMYDQFVSWTVDRAYKEANGELE